MYNICAYTVYYVHVHVCGGGGRLLYSRKCWRELHVNLVVGHQIAIAKILADLNLAVWYGIATCMKYWCILIWWLQM